MPHTDTTFGSHVAATSSAYMGGTHLTFKFPNGYGASVVCHDFSYGGPAGLWEVAVLGPDGRLNYATPVTDDVIGYLPPADVAGVLDQIAALGVTS